MTEDRAAPAARSGDVRAARGAKERSAAALRRLPNVVGVGVGHKIVRGRPTPTVCVRVYVRRKVAERDLAPEEVVPGEIEGVPTDVIEETFRIHVTDAIEEHRRYRAILCGGISVGNAILGGSGTLGSCVFDAKTGEQLLLSNWHVLCGRLDCAPGEAIIQPGTGGGDPGRLTDVVARLLRATLTDVVDAAVARVTGHRMLFQDILNLGRPRGWTAAVLGETAHKSGRTTGVTSATVADVDADTDIDYSELGLGVRHFRHQMVIEGTDASLPGDSGSLWMNDASQAIALNFAGGDSGHRATANPIADVIAALGFRFVPGVTLQDHAMLGAALG